MELKLGGWMPTHQGLRHLPVNAKALDYQCILFSIAGSNGLPLLVSDQDVIEFAKMTRGIECFIQVPSFIHPALPDVVGRESHRAHFLRTVRIAKVLRARAVVMDMPRPWANGKATSMQEIEDRMVDFFSTDLGPDAPVVCFRVQAHGLGNPAFLERILQRLERGSYAMAFDPTRWSTAQVTTSNRQLEAILGFWEPLIKLALFSRVTDEEVGAVRRLAPLVPLILEMSSLAEQALAAEHVRALVEEVDVLRNL